MLGKFSLSTTRITWLCFHFSLVYFPPAPLHFSLPLFSLFAYILFTFPKSLNIDIFTTKQEEIKEAPCSCFVITYPHRPVMSPYSGPFITDTHSQLRHAPLNISSHGATFPCDVQHILLSLDSTFHFSQAPKVDLRADSPPH